MKCVVPSPTCGGELNDANWISWYVVNLSTSSLLYGEATKAQFEKDAAIVWANHIDEYDEDKWHAEMKVLGYHIEGPYRLAWAVA